MSFANIEEAKKHRNQYLIIFVALLGLTIVTVLIAELDLPVPMAIGIALLVASVKASLVAAVFMHLLSEKKVLYWMLALCGLFFVVLLLLPVFTDFEPPWRMLQSH